MQWQKHFAEALSQYFRTRFQVEITEANALEKYIKSLTFSDRRCMWPEVSKILGQTSQKVHDYYHNTWSKRFCPDTGHFASELRTFLREDTNTNRKEAVKNAVAKLTKKYPDEFLHVRTLEQYAYHFWNDLEKPAKRKPTGCCKHEHHLDADLAAELEKLFAQPAEVKKDKKSETDTKM